MDPGRGHSRGAPSWLGKTLVDATNAFKVFDPPTVEVFDFGDRTSSEVVASLAPGASVVKAFNHVPFIQLLSPLPDGEQHVLFVSGDDAAAKAGLRSALEADNFAVIDLGNLATGSRLQQAGASPSTGTCSRRRSARRPKDFKDFAEHHGLRLLEP